MSTFPSADENKIAIVEEQTWGVTPATPAWMLGRITGEGLKPEISKSTSEELNPTANVTSVFPTKGGASGDANFELSYGSFFDILLEHAFRGSFNSFGVLVEGLSNKSLTIEKIIHVDQVPFYKRYPGCRVNSLALEINRDSDGPLGGTVAFMGAQEAASEDAVTGCSYIAAELYQVFYMPEVRSLKIAGVGITGEYCFRQFGFTLNNNCREQQGTCTQISTYPDMAAKGIAYGRKEITLDLAVYFRDLEMNTIFKENTQFELSYILSNGDQGYKFTFPAVLLMEEESPTEGTNSDVLESMSGQAILSQVAGHSIQVEKIANLDADAGIQILGTSSPLFAGTYYKDGSLNDLLPVFLSLDGLFAVWWDSVESKWYVTAVAGIGTVPTDNAFSNTEALPIGGTWVLIGGTTTGAITSAAYNPHD